jgi:hypothetical protein
VCQSVCDKACEILRRTNDGDDLSPEHLWLIQEMVNGHLNELGRQEFEKLYQSPPWLAIRSPGFTVSST